ncbi:hypothetical protein EBU95_10215 [bacterium]|nr:hypothetical protein [bacterium]
MVIYMSSKICIYCKEEKSLDQFPKHNMYKDKLDMRCRSCIKEHASIRRCLHKKAPSKPKLCECCKKTPIKWCLDHDHETNKFRGWICERCNTGLGKLGDNIEGIVKALNYLLDKKNGI